MDVKNLVNIVGGHNWIECFFFPEFLNVCFRPNVENGGTVGSGIPQGSPSVHKSTTDFLQSAYEKQRENVLKLEQERHELKKLRKKNFEHKTPPLDDTNEQEVGGKGGCGNKFDERKECH